MRSLAYGQLREKLREMKGRLTLQATPYITQPGSYAITLSSQETPSKQLYYVPWGIGLSKQANALFPIIPDEMNAESLAGNIPQEWLLEGVGLGGDQSDLLASRKSSKSLTEQEKPSKYATQKRLFLSEPSQMQRLIHSDDNWVFEYLMRSLKVSRDDERVDTGDSGVREALILIVARPEILIDPRVRARLDLLFAEPFRMQVFTRTHAEYLVEIGERLDLITQEMLDNGQVPAVAFLIELGERFRNHIELYQNRFMNRPDRDPFGGLDPNAKIKPNQAELLPLNLSAASMI